MDVAATVTSKGQVTLPKSVRDALGLEPGDRVFFRLHQGRAVLSKVESFLDLAGSVSVPPVRHGASWSTIKTRSWQRRSQSRK